MKKVLLPLLHFLTAVARMIAVYGLNLLLVIALGALFWGLDQGEDILISVIQNQHPGNSIMFYLSIFFFVFVAWYSARIISFRKQPEGNGTLSALYIHIPRLIGFFIYAIIIIGLCNAQFLISSGIDLSGWMFVDAFLIFIAWYMLLYIVFENWRSTYGYTNTYYNLYKTVFVANIIAIVVFGLIKLLIKSGSAYIDLFFLLVMQVSYLFLVISRKIISPDGSKTINTPSRSSSFIINTYRTLFRDNINPGEVEIFTALNIIAVVAAIFYIIILSSVAAARWTGSFVIIITALGLWIGLINFLNMLAYGQKINIGFILIVVMFIGGFIIEPHTIRTKTLNKGQQNNFDNRLNFEQYVDAWYQQHRKEFEDTNNLTVPLLFTLADGGASRSGYWVASVLDSLQDTFGAPFSSHLFCLSGASGGSVGNVTYYSQLYIKSTNNQKNNHFTRDGENFLKTDFLSYPIARLLGPGIITNCIVPLIHDRAWALEKAMMYGTGDHNVLDGFFDTAMSKLVTTNNTAPLLPILCINTTRMQDAMPGFISTVKLNPAFFSNRIDVLSLLPPNKDIPLATAAVLGARFPYFSPAGAIETKVPPRTDADQWSTEYFVDGSYFDNSGAGVVHEMIQQLEKMKVNDTLVKKYNGNLKKMRYCIIHISNSLVRDPTFNKIHPWRNDLAAPLVTLAGSNGSQTLVNDLRLQNFMNALNQRGSTNTNSYHYINLYSRKGEEPFPMSWAISPYNIDRMNKALQQNDSVKALTDYLRNLLVR